VRSKHRDAGHLIEHQAQLPRLNAFVVALSFAFMLDVQVFSSLRQPGQRHNGTHQDLPVTLSVTPFAESRVHSGVH
jgi:hypothetical protein